jgi:hypothetical protein
MFNRFKNKRGPKEGPNESKSSSPATFSLNSSNPVPVVVSQSFFKNNPTSTPPNSIAALSSSPISHSSLSLSSPTVSSEIKKEDSVNNAFRQAIEKMMSSVRDDYQYNVEVTFEIESDPIIPLKCIFKTQRNDWGRLIRINEKPLMTKKTTDSPDAIIHSKEEKNKHKHDLMSLEAFISSEETGNKIQKKMLSFEEQADYIRKYTKLFRNALTLALPKLEEKEIDPTLSVLLYGKSGEGIPHDLNICNRSSLVFFTIFYNLTIKANQFFPKKNDAKNQLKNSEICIGDTYLNPKQNNTVNITQIDSETFKVIYQVGSQFANSDPTENPEIHCDYIALSQVILQRKILNNFYDGGWSGNYSFSLAMNLKTALPELLNNDFFLFGLFRNNSQLFNNSSVQKVYERLDEKYLRYRELAISNFPIETRAEQRAYDNDLRIMGLFLKKQIAYGLGTLKATFADFADLTVGENTSTPKPRLILKIEHIINFVKKELTSHVELQTREQLERQVEPHIHEQLVELQDDEPAITEEQLEEFADPLSEDRSSADEDLATSTISGPSRRSSTS